MIGVRVQYVLDKKKSQIYFDEFETKIDVEIKHLELITKITNGIIYVSRNDCIFLDACLSYDNENPYAWNLKKAIVKFIENKIEEKALNTRSKEVEIDLKDFENDLRKIYEDWKREDEEIEEEHKQRYEYEKKVNELLHELSLKNGITYRWYGSRLELRYRDRIIYEFTIGKTKHGFDDMKKLYEELSKISEIDLLRKINEILRQELEEKEMKIKELESKVSELEEKVSKCIAEEIKE